MKRRVHLKTAPISLKKLIDSIGLENTSKEIGITPWAIRRHLSNNETSPAIELAAKSILGRLDGGSETIIVSADQNTLKFIKTVLEKSNGNYTIIK